MACSWFKGPNGEWLVYIPTAESHGAGTYEVERRDGTSQEVLITRVGDQVRRRHHDKEPCYMGVPDYVQQDRSARIESLRPPEVRRDGAAPRLTRQRDHVVLAESVAERHARSSEPLVVDGLRVWIEPGEWTAWPVDGTRMVRVPVEAAIRA